MVKGGLIAVLILLVLSSSIVFAEDLAEQYAQQAADMSSSGSFFPTNPNPLTPSTGAPDPFALPSGSSLTPTLPDLSELQLSNQKVADILKKTQEGQSLSKEEVKELFAEADIQLAEAKKLMLETKAYIEGIAPCPSDSGDPCSQAKAALLPQFNSAYTQFNQHLAEYEEQKRIALAKVGALPESTSKEDSELADGVNGDEAEESKQGIISKLCKYDWCKIGFWKFGEFPLFGGSKASKTADNQQSQQAKTTTGTSTTGATDSSASAQSPETKPSVVSRIVNAVKPQPKPSTNGISSGGQQGIGNAITSLPTITQLTTSDSSITTTYDQADGGFIIAAEGSQSIGEAAGTFQGAADTLPPRNKAFGEKSSSPPEKKADDPSTPEDESTQEPETSTNPCKEDICIVSPAQDSIFSLTVAKNIKSQIQILSGKESRCTYSVNQDVSFASGEKFIEDQAGVNTQHTIYMYYIKDIKSGKYNIYHKCQDASGAEVSEIQTFTISDSGVDCKIKEGDQTGMTAEVVKDPTTGIESCKVLPLATPELNITAGVKNVTLLVEKNGESVNEIPLTANVVAPTQEVTPEETSPAPGISNPVKIVASSTILALIVAGSMFIARQSKKLKDAATIAAAPLISYPTVAEQGLATQAVPSTDTPTQSTDVSPSA